MCHLRHFRLVLMEKGGPVGEQYTIDGCLEPNIPVSASTNPHVGRDGNHQLYYYYIMG